MRDGRQTGGREQYFWLVCSDPETGRPYLVAGGKTEEECRQKGLELLGGIDFEIRKLPTRNLARASSLLKGQRLESTKNLHKATERLGHERTVRRRLRSMISKGGPTDDWS